MRKPARHFRPTSLSTSVNTRVGRSDEVSRSPSPQSAWQTIPTTVIIGEADELISSDERQWAIDNLTDVRVIDSDHFIPFRQPEAIGHIVLDALRPDSGQFVPR